VNSARIAGVVGCGLMLAGLSGCAGYGGDGSYARFIPTEEIARQALEQALAAWQNGGVVGRVNDIPVEVVDTQRRRGQRLDRFAVLGETAGDGPRCFAVRLHLDGPREERAARFVVYGQSPLWVLRYEDYEMLAHWECRRLDNPVVDKKDKADSK
jgi:hypothetical protein